MFGFNQNNREKLLSSVRRMIGDEQVFLDMLDDRNQTSHIYSEELSKEIFDRIKKNYLSAVKKLLNEIKERIV